jgi:hypothetical protein
MRLQSFAIVGGVAVVLAACADQNPTDPTAATLKQADAMNSEQVVFSGEAEIGTFGGDVGFWIWCEADSQNPYAGECNGAMSFDSQKLTRHVEGEITEPSEGIYVMTVSSTRDGAVSCTLTNSAEAVSGPHNTVLITCTKPSGTATATDAVVNVTGP